MLRMPFAEVILEVERVLLKVGFAPERAELSARLMAEANLDGVPSHGLNRLPRFVRQAQTGVVDIHAEAACTSRMGAWERWDGQRGPGNLNAHACTERAMSLAREHGLGCVALANTNHWMRGGSYGWQAAVAGFGFIGWSNTMPNMPPWGARDNRIGNNPLVMAVPRGEAPVVLDMALSQFSYGRLEATVAEGEELPVPGGHDENGRLTKEAAAILRSGRILPIGFWKGSALSIVLDLLGMMLSAGRATCEVDRDADKETGLSQVFLAIDLARAADANGLALRVGAVLDDLQKAEPDEKGVLVRYPGQRALRTRAENLRLGVPVDPTVWKYVRSL